MARAHAARASGFAVAILLLVSLVAPGAAVAAPPPFEIVSDSTYQVRPTEGLVHVVVDGRATNNKPDTSTQRFYYNSVVIVVLSGATNFSASAAGVRSTVSVVEEAEHQVALEVSLNRSVFYRQTGTFHLEFDLPNGAANGDVRVGANVAAFPMWPVGTPETPGSTVTVSLPPDFGIDVNGEAVPAPSDRGDGGELYRWGPIDDPLGFYPYVIADALRLTQGTFTDFPTTVEIGGDEITITVKSWADDPAWGQRVSDRVTAGMPVLGDLIGLPYIGTARLIVKETVPRTIGGYAGIFDTGQANDEIDISYDADEGVTLHEAAHAWFNEQLASDRWILEGFASYYAELAAGQLGVDPEQISLTDELRDAAFPLDEWQAVGIEEQDAELYGYGASLQAARDLGRRAGTDGLSTVWAAMLANEMPYQPMDAAAPEQWFARNADWRYLLDLLDERTGRSYEDIFSTWVIGPSDRAILTVRATARTTYHELVEAAGAWELPESIRRSMSAWTFPGATEAMTRASTVLDLRDELDSRAADLTLTLPDAMERDFEEGAWDAATEVAGTLDIALTTYDEAVSANDGVDLLEWVGLIGEDPDTELAASAASLASGEVEAATTQAAEARDTWRTASEVGTQRVLLAGGGVFVLILGGAGATLLIRRRRRSVPDPAVAHVGTSVAPAGSDEGTVEAAPERVAGPERDPNRPTEDAG